MPSKNLVIRDVSFIGAGQKSSTVEFKPGLNVLCGASETGKSFLVEAIDFLLGGAELRDIPERVGYVRARIGIETPDNGAWTFERSVDGGNYNVYEQLIGDALVVKSVDTIKAKHAAAKDDNISGWLLKQIGLFDKNLRKNVSGVTRSLSFRDLARLIIVNEKEIIRQDTPFLSGQYVTKTAEYSALKLLLSGTDDSAVVPVAKDDTAEAGVKAKVELLDQWIHDVEDEISTHGASKEELEQQLIRLEKSISDQREQLRSFQAKLNESISNRREVIHSREEIKDRIDEITDLLERFALLREHYKVDIKRLLAIQESGSLFVHHERVTCPLCGSLPEQNHTEMDCDGDVEAVVKAASAEIEKINALESDLEETISALLEESSRIQKDLITVDETFIQLDQNIRATISPDLEGTREKYSEFLEEKNDVSAAISTFSQLEKLIFQKENLLGQDEETDEGNIGINSDLSKSLLNKFSMTVQNILQSWDFPDTANVYFDESVKDFVIDGKPRGSRGKGLRAITHAAVTLGLLEFCQKNNLPHPGFVVMDSPLLAYYEPEGDEDNLQGSDLKQKFYKYLLEVHSDNQIIIIENQHPPEAFVQQMELTIFTKNPQEGRFGLFPYKG
jgi:predicted  nucleic acid-binding Zn-ribbon protein